MEQVLVRDVDTRAFLGVSSVGHVRVLRAKVGNHTFLFIEEGSEEIEEFVPLGTLVFQRED